MIKSRTLRWADHLARIETFLGKPRGRWEGNIRMVLTKYVSVRGTWLIGSGQ